MASYTALVLLYRTETRRGWDIPAARAASWDVRYIHTLCAHFINPSGWWPSARISDLCEILVVQLLIDGKLRLYAPLKAEHPFCGGRKAAYVMRGLSPEGFWVGTPGMMRPVHIKRHTHSDYSLSFSRALAC